MRRAQASAPCGLNSITLQLQHPDMEPAAAPCGAPLPGQRARRRSALEPFSELTNVCPPTPTNAMSPFCEPAPGAGGAPSAASSPRRLPYQGLCSPEPSAAACSLLTPSSSFRSPIASPALRRSDGSRRGLQLTPDWLAAAVAAALPDNEPSFGCAAPPGSPAPAAPAPRERVAAWCGIRRVKRVISDLNCMVEKALACP